MRLLYSDLAMNNRSCHVYFLAGALFVLSFALLPAIPAAAQTQKPTTREIVSEDFTRNRPKGTSTTTQPSVSKQKKSRPRKRVYRLAETSKALNGQPTNKTPLTTKVAGASSKSQQLGITIWRLRPARTRDAGQRILVREKDKSSEWIPERIEADATLRQGDLVRLSIESPREGYLYIVDRDLYSDGTMGDAMLIYPALDMRGGNNQVRAGKLIDIPAQEDDPNYFKASPNRANQVGEVLSIIVTTSPLDLPIGIEPLPISPSQIAQWEKSWASTTERFEMVGGAGQTWTKEEQSAAASNSTRQLTRKEPPPQTIYRVATANKTAFMVEVRLKYTQ